MGPITLFDKSFLQSLTIDESVWFDHFFLANVCPLFFVETLADLEKQVRKGRTPDQEVGIIARKFPEMHGMPCADHVSLCIGELLGHRVPMTGQIPLSSGRLVRVGDKTGVFSKRPGELEAFSRWQKHEFLDIERLYAKEWRNLLLNLDLEAVSNGFRNLSINSKSFKNLENAKALATSIISNKNEVCKVMELAFIFLSVPQDLHDYILQRWATANRPPLSKYAPYVAHVLEVEVLFQIAISSHLISTQRPSNRIDIAYLFYLPFCMMFVSSDRLHQQCAPLFLHENQSFVWGRDLKRNLAQINNHYSNLPNEIKEQGVYSFPHEPPQIGDSFVLQLWDLLLPQRHAINDNTSANEPTSVDILNEIKKMEIAPSFSPDGMDFDPGKIDEAVIKRSVRRRKGSWYQVPKNLHVKDEL
jgi:hypothetical protein